MASTRNKNTKEDYNLEKIKNSNYNNYQGYKFSQQNYNPKYPGFGFTPTQIPGRDLSHNYVTIESQLWGIGANDLENPRQQQVPDFKKMPEWILTEKQEVVLPKPIVIEKNQRHLP